MVKEEWVYLYHPDDDDSIDLLQQIKTRGLDRSITIIEVNDSKTIQWLQHNYSKLHVTEVPCFLARKKNKPPRCYSYQDAQLVFNMVDSLIYQ